MKRFLLFTLTSLSFSLSSCSDNGIQLVPEKNDKVQIAVDPNNFSFKHPGIVHTDDDFARMKRVIETREYPGYGSYESLKESALASSNYTMNGPFEYISARNEGVWTDNRSKVTNDFNAAVQNAIMWKLTGEVAHAEKAKEILLAYAGTLKSIPDIQDCALNTSLAFSPAYAAEILKYSYSNGITGEDIQKIGKMLSEVFVATMEKTFYSVAPYSNGNWGASVNKGYMACAIFLDDVKRFNRALDYYLNGHDNGTITNYIDHTTGQCQESGRDQAHPAFGLGCMAATCEMAYKQGIDLYELFDNALLKGFEYMAQYNWGYEVPFKTWTDVTGKYCSWNVISTANRAQIKPIFENVYNHYVIRKGLKMPYTEEVLKELRPESDKNNGGEHLGYGSLLFYEGGALTPSENKNGLIDDVFDKSLKGWASETAGASAVVEDGKMVISMSLSSGAYRGDFARYIATLHAGKYPILAIKISSDLGLNDKGVPYTCTFETEKGNFGNNYYVCSGKIGDVQYYDLREKPFGKDFMVPTDKPWSTRIRFKMPGLSVPAYTVDWIKTFSSLDELKNYLK